jgi:hypothetical protein
MLFGLSENLLFTSYYLPAQSHLAEAVPGNEGDYPCIAHGPVIRSQSKGLASGAGMVGVLFENKPT